MEQQRGSRLRDRTSFLVLTQTLLLGLGEMSETQHLLTAQRVYSLLEPPLLEATRSEDAQVREEMVTRQRLFISSSPELHVSFVS